MSHSNNVAAQNIRWFNAHTESCGYLNGLKEITPKEGQTFKPFWTSTFCMLEGNPEKPRKTYININIVNAKVVEILKPYANQLNAEGSKVFVTARISDISVEPFVYGSNSSKSGQLGVNWQANLISLIALKVGDMPVDLKKETTTDFGVKSQKSPAASPQPVNTDSLFDLPLVVHLDKNEPDFDVTKARLKDTGYRWNGEKLAWYLASVSLEKTDPAFDEKYKALKDAGYVFSSSGKVWNMPAAPKPQSSSKSQHNRQNTYQGRSSPAQ
jgi:hypothetical protein